MTLWAHNLSRQGPYTLSFAFRGLVSGAQKQFDKGGQLLESGELRCEHVWLKWLEVFKLIYIFIEICVQWHFFILSVVFFWRVFIAIVSILIGRISALLPSSAVSIIAETRPIKGDLNNSPKNQSGSTNKTHDFNYAFFMKLIDDTFYEEALCVGYIGIDFCEPQFL